jgi:hypothetical protein
VGNFSDNARHPTGQRRSCTWTDWLAARYRPDEAPLTALARGDNLGALRSTVCAALGLMGSLAAAESKTKLYRVIYAVVAPLYPVLRTLFPKQVTTTEHIGGAMLRVARAGAPTRVLNPSDINNASRAAS